MRYVRAFGQFWYDFIVGDDWRIAAGVVVVLAIGAVVVIAGFAEPVLTVALFAGLIAVFALPLLADRRRSPS